MTRDLRAAVRALGGDVCAKKLKPASLKKGDWMPTPLTTSRPVRKPDEATPRKLTVRCIDFKPYTRNTLRGFCDVHVAEVQLTIKDVAVHTRDGRSWAQLPAKPQVRDGVLVKDDSGKLVYFPMMTFDDREVADALSRAVLNAVLELAPGALEEEGGR